jgi:hypothetical protein
MVAEADRRRALVGSVVVVVLVLVLFAVALSFVRRNRRSFVPQRGSSIGADLGALADQPRVQIVTVTQLGPERVRLVLRPELGESPDLDLVVVLRDGELGFKLVHDWNRAASLLAIVIPPGSQLVRLRSIDDLQPLTLRRAD